eukprot:1991106-Pyramimonas_sp.AAC.1
MQRPHSGNKKNEQLSAEPAAAGLRPKVLREMEIDGLPSDVAREGGVSPQTDMIGVSEWPASLATSRATLRAHLASGPPSKLWPALETLAGAWATSFRVRVNLRQRDCLLGCP